MKSAEIKELTLTEIKERIEADKEKLNVMKIHHGTSPVENTSVIKKARRDIARMLTILQQKENQK